MRIIGGQFRGRKLATPAAENKAIRPTSDRCREALFSILGERIKNARILDLYAGTGAFAIEAVSRGAETAVMIDNSKTALFLIHKNLELIYKSTAPSIHPSPPLIVLHEDLRKGVENVLRGYSNVPSNFDIIFLDPPYNKGLAQRTLKDLDNTTYLAKDGLVIAEERSNAEITDEFDTLQFIEKRKYGDTCFWFYTFSSKS
ncbi:MAG: 16S rRNA (guanine(966)-N(2))-methyltransferase RsmD [Desulfocapsaceae bacterium]|nr:16S rRNA (guanine(966)-N(2))-methyltransferase RsmD [Desulfocapsaceae bacterium]